MAIAMGKYPEAIFLHRSDGTGYGFFFSGEADFSRAIDSFSKPILRSFQGKPIPNQPDPQAHLQTAIATLVGQAFDRTVAPGAGPEAVAWGAAACVRSNFGMNVPAVAVIERNEGRISARPGTEYLRHPGFPMAVIVHAGPHGGEAHFFSSEAEYRSTAERQADMRIWLPQIVYRLYTRTPSVVAGKPLRDHAGGSTSVEFRAIDFGQQAPLVERAKSA